MIKIRVRSLDVFYGRVQALRKVSLDLPGPAITALIGPSGCGKSTFLRTLNRLNDLIEGTRVRGLVEMDGRNIYGPGCDVVGLRRRVGMVFQRPNPFPMSIYENVAYGPRIHEIKDRSRLDELVERSLRAAALWDEVRGRLRQSALGLSGGQQQRLCIARVLAVEPEVVLMDEPASALDPVATAKVEGLIQELGRRLCLIVVTHSLRQAARVSDRTAFFLSGELVEFGPTGSVLTAPRDKRTEDYVTGRFG